MPPSCERCRSFLIVYGNENRIASRFIGNYYLAWKIGESWWIGRAFSHRNAAFKLCLTNANTNNGFSVCLSVYLTVSICFSLSPSPPCEYWVVFRMWLCNVYLLLCTCVRTHMLWWTFRLLKLPYNCNKCNNKRKRKKRKRVINGEDFLFYDIKEKGWEERSLSPIGLHHVKYL